MLWVMAGHETESETGVYKKMARACRDVVVNTIAYIQLSSIQNTKHSKFLSLAFDMGYLSNLTSSIFCWNNIVQIVQWYRANNALLCCFSSCVVGGALCWCSLWCTMTFCLDSFFVIKRQGMVWYGMVLFSSVEGKASKPYLQRTRKDHTLNQTGVQNRFTGNIGKTSERQGVERL